MLRSRVMAHQNAPQKETLHQHQIIDRPWAKVGADLCDLSGRTLLVVCDYFSGFVEVERLQTTTSNAVSKATKVLFARYRIPNILVTDNGPQFAAAEFAAFANRWGFRHVTSSPRYPQSNGKVENQASLHQVPRGQAVGIPGSPRLAKYPH